MKTERGTCCVCGKQYDISGNRLAPHGYKYHYGFQSGECHGARQPPLESREALAFLKSYLVLLAEFKQGTKASMNAAGIAPDQQRKLARSLKGITHVTKLIHTNIDSIKNKKNA